jgi:hemoglobin
MTSKIPVRKAPIAKARAQPKPQQSLYERLGELYVIALVVDTFSHAILADDLVGMNSPNKALRTWSRELSATRLPGLIHQRTEWLCQVAGGPQTYVPTRKGPTGSLDLENAHCPLKISQAEFNRVAEILRETLVKYNVGLQEQKEVIAAFGAHSHEVVFANRGHGCPFMAAGPMSR